MTQKDMSHFDIRFDDESPDELWREKPDRSREDPGFEDDEIRGLKRRITFNAVIIPLFSLVLAAAVFFILNDRIGGLRQNEDAKTRNAEFIGQRLSALSEAQTFLKGDVQDALKQMEKTAKALEGRIGSLEKSLASLKKSVSSGLDKKDLAAGIEKAVSPVKKEIKKISDLSEKVASLQSRIKGADQTKDLDKKLAGFQNQLKKAGDQVDQLTQSINKLLQDTRFNKIAIKVLEDGKVDKSILERELKKQKQEILQKLNSAAGPTGSNTTVQQGGITEQPLD